MASIVYITDRQMIEYHRINGNRSMNFWRAGTTRKIADFQNGDLLFFLAKGTERGRSREKGIVGYGRFEEMTVASPSQMWKKFETVNGYPSEEAFKEAIIRTSKKHELPKKICGLYLADVVYFQSPIYLSDIGIKVSNLVESFFYLDKEDVSATTKVLKEAGNVGLDMWTTMLSDGSFTLELIEDETLRHNISIVVQKLNPIYTEAERKKAVKISEAAVTYLAQRDIKALPVKGVPEEFMLMSKDRIEIYIPLVVNTKNIKQKIQLVCGHAALIRGTLYQQYPQYYIDTTIIVNKAITQEDRELIETGNANYLFLNQDELSQ